MYGKIVFNNVKEFTPSWIKTVKHSQCARPRLTTGTQKISKFTANPRTKALIRAFQENVCARPAIWQAYIFLNAYVLTFAIYYPWRWVYAANSKGRSIETALAKEKAFKKSQEEEEEQE